MMRIITIACLFILAACPWGDDKECRFNSDCASWQECAAGKCLDKPEEPESPKPQKYVHHCQVETWCNGYYATQTSTYCTTPAAKSAWEKYLFDNCASWGYYNCATWYCAVQCTGTPNMCE